MSGAAVTLFAAIGLFLFSCFSAASDAQGAILFLFTTPLMSVLLVVGALCAWRAEKQRAPSGRQLRWGAITALTFLWLFIGAAAIPRLRPFPEWVIGVVARGYEWMSGESPYAATHRGLDVLELIRTELVAQGGDRLDLGRLRTHSPWDRVCVFGPYSSDAAAQPILKVKDWSIERTSAIATSGGISLLVFIKGDAVVHQVEMPRREADLSAAGMRCFERDTAVFVREGAAASTALTQPCTRPSGSDTISRCWAPEIDRAPAR